MVDDARSQQGQSPVVASVVLQDLYDSAPKDQFTLGWLAGRLPGKSFALLLLLLGILAAVPGICTFASLLIVTCALQMAIGRQAPYFPPWIADRPLPTRHLGSAVTVAGCALRFLERGIRPRGRAPAAAMKRFAAIVMALLNIRILAVWIPFTNVLPASIIVLIALACLEGDALWLPISIALGIGLLAIDGLLAWDLLHNHVRL